MLLAVKLFEIFPKDEGYIVISGSFALNWYIFVALTNKKLLLPLQWRLKQNFLCDLEKLIEYSALAVNVVPFNSRVGPLPKITISFLLLSICTNELISTKKKTFLPQSKFGIEKSEREWNPIPFPEWEDLSVSASFLAHLTLPNNHYFRVKLAFKSCDHVSNS